MKDESTPVVVRKEAPNLVAYSRFAEAKTLLCSAQPYSLARTQVGAGPIGLRTAIELSLMGCRAVHLLEKRGSFVRLNVMSSLSLSHACWHARAHAHLPGTLHGRVSSICLCA